MRDANFVHVVPQLRLRGPVLVARDPQQVSLQKILLPQDMLVGEIEVLRLGGRARLVGFLGHEGFGGDVEGEEVGVDEVEDCGD